MTASAASSDQNLTDAQLARAVALDAAALLQALCVTGNCADADLGRRGDAEANDAILARLRHARPGDFILSEEAARRSSRAARRAGCGSSIRSTARASSASGARIGRCMSGCAIDGAPAAGRGGAAGDGARCSRPTTCRACTARSTRPPRMVVSRTRPTRIVQHVAAALGATLVPMGSAGAKAMAVVRGDADIYLHAGGQYRVGQLRAGRGRARGGAARVADRRVAADLQLRRPAAARSADLPPRSWPRRCSRRWRARPFISPA